MMVGIPAGGEMLTVLMAGCIACCALYGLHKLSQCRLRHCSCCRWFLRKCGTDPFEDFDLLVFVHEVSFTSAGQISTRVRLTAGDQQVSTDGSKKKTFHQPLLISIEQGVKTLLVELVDDRRGKPLAKLEFDVVDDLLKSKGIQQRTFALRECSKEAVNTKAVLSIRKSKGDVEAEAGLLQGMMSEHDAETRMMLQHHLGQVQDDMDDDGVDMTDEDKRMRVLARGCSGPVEVVGSWGGKGKTHLAVLSPPESKKVSLGFWSEGANWSGGDPPKKEIILTRVRGVAPHPQKDDAFVISHCPSPQTKEDIMMYSLDRNRQVWVESLSMLVKMVHDHRKGKAPGRNSNSSMKDGKRGS